ncbi:glycine betaine/proline transport system permease protein [Pseudomonas psychrotolerans]|nr:glycine betaine/proline transport system permease protein [Pseudomonas psychrotolerans]
MLLTDHKLPLGKYIADFIDWLTLHGASVFDKISDVLSTLIHGLTAGLMWFHPLAFIGLVVVGVYLLQRSIGLTVFALAALLLILNLGYWQETMETLAQVVFATLVCIAVGVPLGILAAHKPWFYTGLRPVLDLMQTVPTFVYLIPTLTLFGLGVVPGLISTVVFAVAAPIRLTYLGIQDVPAELMDAGKALWLLALAVADPYRTPARHAQHRCRYHSVHHALAVHGGDRRLGGCRWPGQAGGERAQHRGHLPGLRSRAVHRPDRHPARPGV